MIPIEEYEKNYIKSETEFLGLGFIMEDGSKKNISKHEKKKDHIELRKKLLNLIEHLEQEKQKEETIEEDAFNCWVEGDWDNRDTFTAGFIEGIKRQQKKENTANQILNYILTNDDGVGIALGYNSREMIEQHFKNIGYER